jgi:hypothetical protein
MAQKRNHFRQLHLSLQARLLARTTEGSVCPSNDLDKSRAMSVLRRPISLTSLTDDFVVALKWLKQLRICFNFPSRVARNCIQDGSDTALGVSVHACSCSCAYINLLHPYIITQ